MQPDHAVALVLQGGGALGAYQAGVFQALEAADYAPQWLAGISIGGINAALIAGNAPQDRLPALREFWDRVSATVPFDPWTAEGFGRRLFNEFSADFTAAHGVPGFFRPRMTPPAWLAFSGTSDALSFYDTEPLRETLLELVDFDRINQGKIRLSLGAVHVQTGNFTYFDNHDIAIGPEHIMASSALPPGFPPVWIDGEAYWDGGLVSNTPLQYVLDQHHHQKPLTIFQIDLFSAHGSMPKTINDVMQREKDIRYSSRTRLNTDIGKQFAQLHETAARLRDKLPPEFADDPDLQKLVQAGSCGPITIMHLINRQEDYESQSKDYEFSRITVNGHWQAGYADTLHSLSNPKWTRRGPPVNRIAVYDLGPAAPADRPEPPPVRPWAKAPQTELSQGDQL